MVISSPHINRIEKHLERERAKGGAKYHLILLLIYISWYNHTTNTTHSNTNIIYYWFCLTTIGACAALHHIAKHNADQMPNIDFDGFSDIQPEIADYDGHENVNVFKVGFVNDHFRNGVPLNYVLTWLIDYWWKTITIELLLSATIDGE